MAISGRPWLLLCLFFLAISVSVIPFSSCQSPQNIEVFYPFPIETPSPSPAPSSFRNPPNSSAPRTKSSAPPPLPSAPSPQPLAQNRSSSNRNVVKAVAATAGSTLVVATLLFFLIQRCIIGPRRRKQCGNDSSGAQPVVINDQVVGTNGKLEALVVDENGLDVIYWRRLEGENKKNSFNEKVFPGQEDEDGEEEERMVQGRNERRKSQPIQEIPLLRGKSSASRVVPEIGIAERNTAPPVNIRSSEAGIAIKGAEKQNLTSQHSNPPHPTTSSPPQPPLPPPPPPPPYSSMAIPHKHQLATPVPPPPPIAAKKNQAPPPPPPKAGLSTSSKLPPALKGITNNSGKEESSTGAGMTRSENGQVKLKPLHWDKVNTNTNHSMVWDKIDGGSFRFDDDLMEALFGYVATNRRSPQREKNSSTPNNRISNSSAQIVILDARKSQNMAIVIKSMAIPQKKLLDALTNGQGLETDTLEKLVRIAPTEEEQSQILEFNGDHGRLADAESFLYHLLKAVPSAFTRLDAMFFRSNYGAEILHFKESLQILELGCRELRNRGLFMKLLEAILKAGNRMNAGTLRGNAHAFKLTSLRKLFDVKSTDGKTTLLHFVVEEVVRSEGKRCVINRNRSLSRNSSRSSRSSSSSSSSIISENTASKEEREKEYIMLGLPVVGGLSAEFSNAKKAAEIDNDTFACTCSALIARTTEVKQLVSQCATNGEGGFGREMKGFLEEAEEDLKALRGEQERIMELVKRTTDYYQARAPTDQGAHPLQLFVIIKDFLDMVDQVCVEIARNLQRKKTPSSSMGSSPKSPSSRTPVRFPNLPERFMKEKSSNSSTESDADF